MSSDCAICYVSDINFLLPSLVSATELRKYIPTHKADIFIFTVGVDIGQTKEISRFLSQQQIYAIPLDEVAFEALDKDRLTRTSTPKAMFGRLFMHELLPASCRRIIYLDGDMWIAKDPSQLIDAVVPEGRLAAAEDSISFRQNFGFGATARGIKEYFSQLGLKPQNGYFNSGIFSTSIATWKTISREAYDYYIKNAALCEHSPDQSALNAIIGDRRLRLSCKWNFQTQFKIWGVDRYVTPHICHFNRYPKPWMGVCAPWTDMHAKYQTAIAPFAALNLPLKTLSPDEMAGYNSSTAKSYSYLQLPLVSRAALRLMKFKQIENSSWV